MAKVYGPLGGPVAGFRVSTKEEVSLPLPTPPPAVVLVFDERTNEGLLSRLQQSTTPFAFDGSGMLTEHSQPVTLLPTDPAEVERTAATDDLRTQYDTAITALDQIINRNGVFTILQAGQAIDAMARIERRLLRLLKAQVG